MYLSKNNKQHQRLQVVVNGLVRELAMLAPHPDRPDYKGPVFLPAYSCFQTPSETDGMLGSLILESFLGVAFAHAAMHASAHQEAWSAAAALPAGWMNAADLCDEYWTDRVSEEGKPGQGKGTFALMSKKGVSNDFNSQATKDVLMAAFERDLPRRLRIERALSQTIRQLTMGENNMPAPGIAA